MNYRNSMKHFFLSALILMTSNLAWAQFKGTDIEYSHKDKKFLGYMVKPTAKGKKKLPAILMVHNWMGVTDETKKQADRFADLGYVVFAADIYGQGQNPKDVATASQLAGKYKSDRKLFRDHLKISLDELKKQKDVDTKKIAAAGYCFGGTGVIELARSGADIKGTISFHGGLDSLTPNDAKKIKGKMLILHGAIDPFISDTDLKAFQDEMNKAKVDYQFISYANAVHSFTEKGAGNDVSKGAAYNELADQRSFIATENFLKEIFK